MIDTEKPIVVSAPIVTRKNKDGQTEILNVLAHNKDKYGFPGGKLNDGETPEQAVIRETEEELGATPTNIEYKDTFTALTPDGRGIEMHIFTGRVSSEITPNNEIAELHWLTYEQMDTRHDILTPLTIEHVMPLLEKL